MRSLIPALLILAASAAEGQTIYKCQVDGRVAYSGSPCYTGVEVKRMAPDGGPTPEDRARARMRVEAELRQQRTKEADERAIAANRAAYAAAQGERDETRKARRTAAQDNEKILTGDISGWDRKSRSQLHAEAEARATGRAPERTGATWETEETLSHSLSGWSKKSGYQKVQEAAAVEQERREMERAAAADAQSSRKNASEDEPMIRRDQFGKTYNVNGNRAVQRETGKRCTVDISDRVRC
ncbi:MAG: hypothetical protein BroJett026_35400 [Betaproteobacteria bacterium]|nr:MAG: hypothetical protein BroJett026_35400 [Betaproteobacteria bacterium]